MQFIGYDLGSSSIKVAVIDGESGKKLAQAQYPDQEMAMISTQEGWAEQHPEVWWKNLQKATDKLYDQHPELKRENIKAIGMAYQMHGLVAVDKKGNPVRPSIIWCDSRAVEIGNKAFIELGKTKCLQTMLNSPGNFTASKLKWVQENEPEVYEKIYKVMLPGDYIAYKFTEEFSTTVSGLSEGILWDFEKEQLNRTLLEYYKIDESLLPAVETTFAGKAKLSKENAALFGFDANTVVSYRAGDQPNNALSLNVLEPGEIAATGGTSGVVYSIVDNLDFDPYSRVNTFAHVNHTAAKKRLGKLLCINGAGSAYSWLRRIQEGATSYDSLEQKATKIPVGADGLAFLPFGNGAERLFQNHLIGAHFHNLQFNRHEQAHIIRACLEGVAFAFVYGIHCMEENNNNSPSVINVGNDNMFQSSIFSNTIATLTGAEIRVKEMLGAVGAALGAAIGVGYYSTIRDAFKQESIEKTYQEDNIEKQAMEDAYGVWKKHLDHHLKEIEYE